MHVCEITASKYYAPDLHEKQGFDGPPTKSTTAIITNPSNFEQGIGANKKHPLSDSRAMSVLQGHHSHGINQNIVNVNGNKHGPLNTSIYHQAASMNSAGYYATNANVNSDMVAAVDDYSFSNIDLGNWPPGVTLQGNTPPGMTNANKEGKGNFRDKLLQWCISALTETSSSSNNTHGHLPPNMNDRSCDWGVANGIKLNGMNKKQGGLGSTQKLGLGLLLMVLVCTIFGVMVSELKKVNTVSNVGHEGNQLSGFVPAVQLAPAAPVPSPNPTLWPSISPIEEPTTPSPTKMPVTESPISDNYAAHSKTNLESDGITRPTRSPVTNRPSIAPSTHNPTGSPTVKVASVQAAPGGAGSCTDNNDGFFSNHLGNPFNCTWLHNGKSGYTDRKDKNCGGRPVVDELNGGTVVYETSELGRECPKTCRLYNGCADPGTYTVVGAIDGMTLMEGQVESKVFSACQDSQGHFSNHLSSLTTCEWLYNDKEGRTDRKDKNCGTAEHPVTELGRACKSTCSIYNGCECTGGEVMAAMASSGGEQKFERTGSEHADYHNDTEESVELEETEEKEEIEETKEPEEREDSEETEEETEEESSMSSPPKKNEEKLSNTNTLTSCHDAEGKFLNHESNSKHCEWLFNDKEGRTDRKDMNCGTAEHPVTELGRACKSTCSIYNGCECTGGEVMAAMASSGGEQKFERTGSEHADYHNDTEESVELEETEEKEEIEETKEPEEREDSEETEEETEEESSMSSPPKKNEEKLSNTNTLTSCHDAEGKFLNHESHPKHCEWLFNDKEGRTDRKDKNCGTAEHPVTELGVACKSTCSIYDNRCATDVQLHELIMINSGQVVRSYSSPSYSFSLTSSMGNNNPHK